MACAPRIGRVVKVSHVGKGSQTGSENGTMRKCEEAGSENGTIQSDRLERPGGQGVRCYTVRSNLVTLHKRHATLLKETLLECGGQGAR